MESSTMVIYFMEIALKSVAAKLSIIGQWISNWVAPLPNLNRHYVTATQSPFSIAAQFLFRQEENLSTSVGPFHVVCCLPQWMFRCGKVLRAHNMCISSGINQHLLNQIALEWNNLKPLKYNRVRRLWTVRFFLSFLLACSLSLSLSIPLSFTVYFYCSVVLQRSVFSLLFFIALSNTHLECCPSFANNKKPKSFILLGR